MHLEGETPPIADVVRLLRTNEASRGDRAWSNAAQGDA